MHIIEITFVILISVGLLANVVKGPKSECSIISVGAGEITTLTCKFEKDLKIHQYQFQVHRDCLRQSKSQETILFCAWKNGNPDCHMHPRVWFNGNITNQIQLQLRNVTLFDEGRYECVMLPFSVGDNADCIFALKGPEATSVKPASNENTTDLQNAGESKGNLPDTSNQIIIGVAIGSVLSTIISISITILIVFCLFNCNRRFGYKIWKNSLFGDRGSGETGIQETEPDTDLRCSTPRTDVDDERLHERNECASTPLLNVHLRLEEDKHVNPISVSSDNRPSQCCKLENDVCSNLTAMDLESRTSTCNMADLNLRDVSSDYDDQQQSLDTRL